MPRAVVADARWVALQTLLQSDRDIPVQAALDGQLRGSALSSQDRALAAELVYGVLRTRLALDAELATVLPNPRKLPAAIRHALAIGLYSLRYAERIPVHAALDTAVSIARRVGGQRMANLVNACLRRLSRREGGPAGCHESPQGKQSQDGVRQVCVWTGSAGDCDVWSTLGTRFALPSSIVSLWREAYGEAQAIQLMCRSFSRPWTGLRVNASFVHGRRLSAMLEDQPDCVRIGDWGFAFAPGDVPQTIAGETVRRWQERGALSFQAAGSQLVMEKLGLYGIDGVWWDCCCGVGGKSLALLERGRTVSLCSDMSAQRLGQFGRDCRRLGIVSPETMEADASSFTPAQFGGNVLVDAPCSSMGVLARRPDVKKRSFDADALGYFVRTQRAILDTVATVVEPGRHIAYMTCTLNPDENEVQICGFLERHRGFELLGQWQTPHGHPWLEGMFGALLRRRPA